MSNTEHTILVGTGGAERLKRRAYKLTVGKGRSATERVCTEDVVTIGSNEQNGLVIAHPTVSRFHARIELVADGYLLTDLESTNGTYVNGVRVLSAYLEPPARLRFGEVEVTFDLEQAETELDLSAASRFGSLVGRSPAMRRMFSELEQIARADTTVLVQGETGVGKDVVANEIHRHSARREGPFVVVDCAGIPEMLLESALFGHERGAFTGADRERVGAFEEASGGTVFLDEIAELSMQTQVKLLRVLESRAVQRLGSSTWKPVDVRIIAATHQDLALLCNRRQFREDLYFRLAVIPVRIPPLRERLEDIPLLVSAVLDEMGLTTSMVMGNDELEALKRRRWAGNVRELRNLIERASVFGPGAFAEDSGLQTQGGEVPFKIAKAQAVEEFERRYLEHLLTRHRGNVAQAARAGQVDAAWIFRLVKRHGIDLAKLRLGPPTGSKSPR